MRFLQTTAVLAITAAFACSGEPTGIADSSRLAVQAGDPGATGVVRGMVVGDWLDGTPDTSFVNHERIAGATIEVFHEMRSDSTNGQPVEVTLERIGSVLSDAEGRFELTRVPANYYYRLEVTPPQGSTYAAGTSGSVAFTSGVGQAVVYLYRRPAVASEAGIRAELTAGGVRVTNTTSERVAFHVRNPNWLGLLALCETEDAVCERLPANSVITVPFSEIYGFENAGPISLDWWNVERVDDVLRPGTVHTIVVR
jgi:hypothetical protein